MKIISNTRELEVQNVVVLPSENTKILYIDVKKDTIKVDHLPDEVYLDSHNNLFFEKEAITDLWGNVGPHTVILTKETKKC